MKPKQLAYRELFCVALRKIFASEFSIWAFHGIGPKYVEESQAHKNNYWHIASALHQSLLFRDLKHVECVTITL